MIADLQTAARRAVAWAREDALPLWADAGFDRVRDRFREALDAAGRPVTGVPERSRVQGRQMTVYGLATVRGWFDGSDLVDRVFRRGYAAFRHPDGGYVASIHADGSAGDPTRYAYEQSFVLLGFAWHERLFRSGAAAEAAEDLWSWLEARLATPATGGFSTALGLSLPRAQNPHMHLLEACLAWCETTGARAWRDRAAALVDLFDRHFLDRDNGVASEVFDDAFAPTLPDSVRIEPGHHAEWIALLVDYALLTGTPVSPAVGPLHRAALGGRNPATGLLFDETRDDFTPTVATSRLWTAAEMLKAEIALHELAGGGFGDIARATGRIIDRHLSGVRPGLWIDKVDHLGRPVAANVPASTLYHLAVAVAALERVAGLAAAGPRRDVRAV
ncbi:MAG TPA: AGE family epimerase/isomerase [Bauldia sp.]|nr:AGE family epimerase/isomerase [Bauldia sp.]